MKKNYFVIINSILLLVLIYSLYNLYKPIEYGTLYNTRYSIIERSLTKLEKNMNEITNSTDEKMWTELKKLNNAEKSQEEGYNMLIKDIKNCYLDYKNLNDEKTDNLKILDYQGKKRISKQDLTKLAENSCLDSFDKYSNYKFSSKDYLNQKLQTQIELILDVKELDNNYNFADIIIKESDVIHSIANLSTWLTTEYNTYK